ncbi:transglutaminaseTgpA domain-containing protein [Enemella sp. A6]|uniref:transglutaminaseTgpA domain-containing protein n=1 Tax=Enemella sp. A6 TaxID=3440152 RepID=UPI003EBA87AE
MRVSDRNALATVVAVFLAGLCLKPLTTDMSYLPLAAVLIALVVGIGALLRRLRVNNGMVFGAQVLIVAVYLFGIGMSLGEDGGWWSRLGQLYAGAVGHIQSEAAPLPPHPGVKLLLVTAIGLVAILTDVLVSGVDRPAWSFIPMLSLYLIPALGLPEDISAWYLVLLALGYLGILFVDSLTSAESWPRNLIGRRRRRGGLAVSAGRMALVVAIPTLVLTLLVGTVMPLPSQMGWGFTRPSGSDGPLQLTDPTLDLRRNLSRPENRVVMTYTTDQDSGAYLRMASLPMFDSRGWQIVPMQLQTSKDLPPPPGLTSPAEDERTTKISVGDFRSEYLPLPYSPRSFDAEGDWAYDPISLVVLATGGDREEALRNLTYTAKSVDIQPDGARLSSAAPGRPEDIEHTAALPPDLPPEIIDLTVRITKDADSPALKAAAIQAFLRGPDFTYSLDPQPGTGYQALENFLLNDRRGYCEQFAGSMALMARIVGIPSRVSVGFLPGKRNADGTWEVSLHDMHAWPELYFEGEGWVRFEPTPAIQSGNPPPWTVEGEGPGDDPEPSPPPQDPSGEPSAEPSAEPTAQPSEEPTQDPGDSGAEAGAISLRRVLLVIGVVALLTGLALLPGLLRRRSRTKRLAPLDDPADQVEAAWDEVRATVTDLGQPWPEGTPRSTASTLGAELDVEGRNALTRLSRLVERARFGPSPESAEGVPELVDTVTNSLLAQEEWDARFVAKWWPRSFFDELREGLPFRGKRG